MGLKSVGGISSRFAFVVSAAWAETLSPLALRPNNRMQICQSNGINRGALITFAFLQNVRMNEQSNNLIYLSWADVAVREATRWGWQRRTEARIMTKGKSFENAPLPIS
jgi:hypothetical protein